MTTVAINDSASRLQELKKQLAKIQPARGKRSGAVQQPTAAEQELFAETARALRAWKASPAGREFAGSARTMTPEQIGASMRGMLTSPEFAHVNELATKKAAFSFPLKAVSAGVGGSIELIIGVQGNVGVAVNPADPLDGTQDVLYATGAVDVGIDEGGEVGIVVGFWNVAPVDLGGTSYGWELQGAEGVGFYVEASYSHIDGTGLLGYSVSVDSGEEVGADGDASYTLVWQTTPIYQPPAANYMILTSIYCNDNSESGHDEVYFFFTIDGGTRYRYPTQGEFSMTKGDTWNAGRSIRFNSSAKIELFDQDDTSNDDSLGTFTYTTSNFPTSQQVSGSGGKYTLSAVLNPVWKAYQ